MRPGIVAGLAVGTIAGMVAGITVARRMNNTQAAQKWMRRGKRLIKSYMQGM